MEARPRGLSLEAGARFMARRPSLASVAALAWLTALGVQLALGDRLHHGGAGTDGLGTLVPFAAVWTAHVIVMMLPSTIPMLAVFGRAAQRDGRPLASQSAFVSGYILVWVWFGVAALLADGLLHRLVEVRPELARPHLIPGVLLSVAGLFQFSPLKDRCLTQCRHPGAFLLRHYRQGVPAALRLGAHHGLFCLGCCWALMLVVFALGAASLLLMVPAAALMYLERVSRIGPRIVVPLGSAASMTGLALVVISI